MSFFSQFNSNNNSSRPPNQFNLEQQRQQFQFQQAQQAQHAQQFHHMMQQHQQQQMMGGPQMSKYTFLDWLKSNGRSRPNQSIAMNFILKIIKMLSIPISVMHNEMQQQQQQQQQRSNGDGTLSPTSNQLARWFSPELLAQGTRNFNKFLFDFAISLEMRFIFNSFRFCIAASAGKLPSLDATQALSLEEFERNMHSSTTVNN